MMFALLFFNISFIAIIGYSHSLKVDFQRLIQIQQAGQAIFVSFEQAPYRPFFYSVYSQKIMTQTLSQSEECQQIKGYLADNLSNMTSLYLWSCYQ